MTWADYTVPVKMIPTGDGKERPVRGLSSDDIGLLVVNHLDTMMEITTVYIQTNKDVFAATNLTDMAMLVAREFPAFVSEVISVVTDEPTLRDKKLPILLQLQILTAAIHLTVEDSGGLGNLTAMLQSAFGAAVAGRGEVSQKLKAILSQSSIGDAAKT